MIRNTSQASREHVKKHLDLFESWRSDHAAALNCYALEDWLLEGLKMLDLMENFERRFRASVHAGEITGDAVVETSRAVLGDYAQWQSIASTGIAAVETARREFGQVEHAAAFRDAFDRVRAKTDAWKSPQLALSPSVRLDVMDDDDAAELRAILSQPSAPPARVYTPVPLGDPSLLR